ncbi:MAG: tetratricopeptide repeat protein [Acidobacteriota bacterium]
MDHQRVMALVDAALDLDVSARQAFLGRECAGRPALRAEIESLLAEEDEALHADFLDVPAALEIGAWLDSGHRSGPGRGATGRSLTASDRVGSYRVLEELGRGGMGTVYLAEQHEPIQRRIALKVIHGFGTRWGSRRFAAECRALARLKHPNIAAVYDAGVADEGRAFVAMEWVEGSHITDWCDRRKLSIRDRIELVLGVCAGVGHAHQKGLVHRDLKPSNVLVSDVDGEAVAKVIDFGIARSLDDSEVSTAGALEGPSAEPPPDGARFSVPGSSAPGSSAPGASALEHDLELSRSLLAGSPIYMSPEAAAPVDRSDVDTRSDVYSLGILLYVLLVGKPPFEVPEMGVGALLRRIQTTDPLDASRRWSGLDTEQQVRLAALRGVSPGRVEKSLRGDLDAILGKALARQRDERYSAVSELAADLRRHLSDQPVEAREPSWGYQLLRFARRNLGTVTAVAAVVGVLIVGVAATTLEARRANLEAERARQALTEAEQVSDFMIGLFETVDPDRSADDPESVDELLARAESTIDEELADQPLAKARFLQTIGSVAFNRADLERAAGLYEKSLDLRRQHLAPGHAHVVRSLGSLGVIYRRQGREAEAEAALVEAIELYESSGQPEIAPYAATLSWLANLHYQQKRYEDAAAGHRQALELRRQEVPESPGAIGESLNNLSLALRDQGRVAEAKPLLLEAESYFVRAFGPEHPLVASCWFNRAGIEEKLGNWHEAEGLLTRAAEHFRRMHEPHHYRTVTADREIGALWSRWHRFDEAAEHLTSLLQTQRSVPEGDRLEIAQTQSLLGRVLRHRGDLDAAEGLLRAALGTYTEVLGSDHYLTQGARLELAVLTARRGEGTQAAAELSVLLAEREATHGREHAGVAQIASALGRVLYGEAQIDAADEAFSRALGIHGAAGNESSVEAAKDQLWLGRVRLEQGRVDDASSLLERSRDLLRQLLPPEHPDRLAAEADAERARDLSSPPDADSATATLGAIAGASRAVARGGRNATLG